MICQVELDTSPALLCSHFQKQQKQMKFSFPIITAIAATPAMGYSFGGVRFVRPSVLVSRPTSSCATPDTYGSRSQIREAFTNRAFKTSPRYKITNTDETFEISLDVPGVNFDDIDVSIDNNVLTLSGQRQQKSENYRYSSKFYQSFSLDPTIDVDKVTASLNNGVLVVSAPKNLNKVENTVKKIPISNVAAAVAPSIEVHPSVEAATEVESKTEIEAFKDVSVPDKQDDDTEKQDLKNWYSNKNSQ